jgi:hypothetical protein
MSRNARTPAPRSRRIALGFGTAGAAAAIAAALSTGTAPVAGADVSDVDAISSAAASLDATALSAASLIDPSAAATVITEPVPEADAISWIISFYDPDAFTTAGAPSDPLGIIGYYSDNYLFGPNGVFPFVDADLQTLVTDLANSGGAEATSGAAVSVADLVGGLDPGAFGAGAADLTAPVIDGVLNSGLSLF